MTSATDRTPANESRIMQADIPGLSLVHPQVVEKIGERLRAQTKECVMETLGISANTWMKMRQGMPVRRSLAERLLRRVGMDQ